jgi:hypothetical protein
MYHLARALLVGLVAAVEVLLIPRFLGLTDGVLLGAAVVVFTSVWGLTWYLQGQARNEGRTI